MEASQCSSPLVYLAGQRFVLRDHHSQPWLLFGLLSLCLKSYLAFFFLRRAYSHERFIAA
jgi:hypothetical protein